MSTTTWTLRQHRPHGAALLALLILVGMVIVLVGVIGLSLWQQTQTQAVAPPITSPPIRDAWYLDATIPASVNPPVRDDWARTTAPASVNPPARDDWARTAPSVNR